MPQCTAAAERLVCCKRPSCRRNGCAAFSACGTRRYGISHAVISVRGTNALLLSVAKLCQHLGMICLHCIASQCAMRCKQPSCPRNRCTAISGRSVCRYSIAHAVNRRSAATAPRQLSVTQHLPAPDADAAVQSSCWVSPMLHAPNLPPKQMHHDFKAQCAPIQHRSRRPRHTSTHTALCDIAAACIRAR